MQEIRYKITNKMKKNNVLRIRVTEEQKQLLKATADKESLTMSELIRLKISELKKCKC
jgi:antitoxin component of RelBE/YafQ-DinJ toxin-antitoxin module